MACHELLRRHDEDPFLPRPGRRPRRPDPVVRHIAAELGQRGALLHLPPRLCLPGLNAVIPRGRPEVLLGRTNGFLGAFFRVRRLILIVGAFVDVELDLLEAARGDAELRERLLQHLVIVRPRDVWSGDVAHGGVHCALDEIDPLAHGGGIKPRAVSELDDLVDECVPILPQRRHVYEAPRQSPTVANGYFPGKEQSRVLQCHRACHRSRGIGLPGAGLPRHHGQAMPRAIQGEARHLRENMVAYL